jgi:hypothetical protein
MLPTATVSADLFLNDLNLHNTFLMIVKVLFVLGILLYTLFSGLILRQIQLMSNTVQTSFTPALWVFGLIHFGLTFLVLLYLIAL